MTCLILKKKSTCTFVSLCIHKIEDTFPERRGVTDPVRSDLRYRLLLHLVCR